jgi:glyoxylase-like metal-dependent hydrolase (beta-lactamase superfamily II)
MVIISVLIEHPTEGLLLFETGGGKDYPEVWGAPINDVSSMTQSAMRNSSKYSLHGQVFARVDYEADHELEAQIAKTGHNIKDIKGVIMGHLHLDHAGGLEHFVGTDVLSHQHFSIDSN